LNNFNYLLQQVILPIDAKALIYNKYE
jgi:hypothetical protein